MADFVRRRSYKHDLEVDSSQLNVYLLKILLQEFPQAKFLLTIRDCYSWLDSMINYCLRSAMPEPWLQFRALRFGSKDVVFAPQEQILYQRDLYTLKGYLSYWASHNQAVLAAVPKGRLMVVKTGDITASAYNIAEFAGLPESSVRIEASHASRTPKRFGIVDQLDTDCLDSQVQRYCGDLMQRFFPRIRSIRDLNLGY